MSSCRFDLRLPVNTNKVVKKSLQFRSTSWSIKPSSTLSKNEYATKVQNLLFPKQYCLNLFFCYGYISISSYRSCVYERCVCLAAHNGFYITMPLYTINADKSPPLASAQRIIHPAFRLFNFPIPAIRCILMI